MTWDTPREAALRVELDLANQKIRRLQDQLGPPLETESALLETVPILNGHDLIQIEKHTAIQATRNEYGALHVAAEGKTENGKYAVDYYVAAAGCRDADNFAILAASHKDFVMRLARIINERKL